MTSSYVDIDREVNDFVTKGFPANNSVKFGFEASVPEGILLKGNIDRQFKENKDKGVKEITNLTFEPSITLKDLKVKSKIGTNPDKEASVEFSNLFTNGISLELGAKERSQNHFATVGYKTQQFNVQATASAPFDRTHANSSYKIDASAVLNYPNDMYWGLQAAVARPCVSVSPTGKDKDVKAGWQPSLSGKLHLISLNTTLSVEPGRQKPEKPLPYTLSILFNQKLTPNIRVATKFTCSTDIEESSTLDVALEQKKCRWKHF